MRNYCTLFDSKYLPQGLALYESLVKHSSEPFTLHVLALDNACLDSLHALGLPHVEIVNLPVFEILHNCGNMQEIRKSRTWQEYCWMLASQFVEFLLDEEDLPEVTYLDADTLMFSDPAVVFAEIGEASIAITPHRLIPSKRHLEVNGKFNVGWVTFTSYGAGYGCATTWAKQCRDRCSAEVGCGDQQYLDEWPLQYRGDCHIIQNIGVNAAPWNIGNWEVTEGPRVGGVPVVLFHYHETRFNDDGTVARLTNYELRPEDIEFLYKPYIAAVTAAKARIESLHVSSI